MVDDTGVFSGTGGTANTDPAYQVGPVDSRVLSMADTLAKLSSGNLTPVDIPIIFKPAAQADNAAILTAMVTQLTKDSPENLAAITTIVGAILKIKVS